MFYSHDILQKRGGKFGIVWVAATRSSELTRREYMSVRVKRTCDDIIDYILLRVPSTTRGRTRPRFSLYLSAQLMYGTVKVFRKQHQFLYDDTSTLWARLRMSGLKTSTCDIDLKLDAARQNLPDLVGTVDPLSADYNYTFGMWEMTSEGVSFMEQDMWQSISVSPTKELQLSPLPLSMEEMVEDALKSPHTVSKPEDIRLKEDESLTSERIQVPDEKELPGFDGKEIEMMEDKVEEIPIEIADLISPLKTRSRSTSSMSDIMPVIMEEEEVLHPLIETPHGKKVDDEGVPPRRKLPASPGVTPIQPEEPSRKRHRVRPSLAMELEPVAPTSVTRRRKRRLKFIDIETQISKKQLKHNMVTSKDICRTNVLPSTRPSLPEELFSRPCKKELCHPTLLRLWMRNAVMGEEIDDTPWTVAELMKSPDEFPESRQTRRRLSPILDMESPRQVLVPPAEAGLSGSDLDLKQSPLAAAVHSTDSDKSSRTRRSKRLADQPSAEKMEEGDSMEVARGDSVLSLERSRQRDLSIEIDRSTHSLERSRERSMEDSLTSRPRSRRGSDQLTAEEEILAELVQEQDGMSGLLPLETVQEEQEVVPPVVRSPSTESNYTEEMMRHVEQRTATKTWTRFHTICGTHNTFRSYAAKMFNAVLDLCGNQTLEAKQKEAYSDIYLRRGRSW
ncbi:meiotic recombination protein REC8 homolog isoform X1 [Haliotis rufescens]|uniref:meiotic recombination protein REC8 homolog isoform X1 n=1 Tax=Haliotis rufescens TaxID=6454 RepID=UPI00201F6DB6|nr:meiotic recombination protein REC8 homolog isoform X1 [Haliotis rufescens]